MEALERSDLNRKRVNDATLAFFGLQKVPLKGNLGQFCVRPHRNILSYMDDCRTSLFRYGFLQLFQEFSPDGRCTFALPGTKLPAIPFDASETQIVALPSAQPDATWIPSIAWSPGIRAVILNRNVSHETTRRSRTYCGLQQIDEWVDERDGTDLRAKLLHR